MDEDDKLQTLERSITEAVVDRFGIEEDDSDAFVEKFMELFEDIKEDCEASNLQSFKDTAPSALSEIREASAGFEARNFERWKPSFDHLEMMWSVSQEMGEMHGKSIKAEGGKDADPVMAALASIFPRALLVVQEIICLLKGGFPDGALARWRTLHELSVTAAYIAKHGEVAAVPYLVSFHFAARRAAHQMNEHSEQAQITKFSDIELQEFDAHCSAAEQILGRVIEKDRDGEWPAITQSHKNFAALEKDVGLDHWRPRYKWASTHTHAHFRPMDKLLGMQDGDKALYLIGASNSGFVDPFQMTAITLSQITMTYLFHGVNVDRIVHVNAILKLADQMSSIAIDNERITLDAFMSKVKS